MFIKRMNWSFNCLAHNHMYRSASFFGGLVHMHEMRDEVEMRSCEEKEVSAASSVCYSVHCLLLLVEIHHFQLMSWDFRLVGISKSSSVSKLYSFALTLFDT